MSTDPKRISEELGYLTQRTEALSNESQSLKTEVDELFKTANKLLLGHIDKLIAAILQLMVVLIPGLISTIAVGQNTDFDLRLPILMIGINLLCCLLGLAGLFHFRLKEVERFISASQATIFSARDRVEKEAAELSNRLNQLRYTISKEDESTH